MRKMIRALWSLIEQSDIVDIETLKMITDIHKTMTIMAQDDCNRCLCNVK